MKIIIKRRENLKRAIVGSIHLEKNNLKRENLKKDNSETELSGKGQFRTGQIRHMTLLQTTSLKEDHS